MTPAQLEILYEDNHLLVVNKPAGLATMGVAEGQPSLVTLAKQYLKHRYHKPGNVYLGIVSRLDALVSGAIVLARTSKAAARLTEQFRAHQAEKTYWAIVAGVLEPASGELQDWLIKDDARMRMVVASSATPGASEALLQYRQLRLLGANTLAEVQLLTGRKHQIRLQLSSRGHAVLGDKKYGSQIPFAAGIALHSRRLVVEHPTRQEPIEVVAPLPMAWQRLGVSDKTA